MCLLFLGHNMVAPGHPKGSASRGSPVCQLPSVCLRQRTFWESLRSPQDAESPDDTLSAVYSAPDRRGSTAEPPWEHRGTAVGPLVERVTELVEKGELPALPPQPQGERVLGAAPTAFLATEP